MGSGRPSGRRGPPTWWLLAWAPRPCSQAPSSLEGHCLPHLAGSGHEDRLGSGHDTEVRGLTTWCCPGAEVAVPRCRPVATTQGTRIWASGASAHHREGVYKWETEASESHGDNQVSLSGFLEQQTPALDACSQPDGGRRAKTRLHGQADNGEFQPSSGSASALWGNSVLPTVPLLTVGSPTPQIQLLHACLVELAHPHLALKPSHLPELG